MRRARACALAALVVCGCVACGGKSANQGTLHPKQLSKLVLHAADLAHGYTLVENGHGARYEVPPGDAARARTTGWIARFRLDGSAKVPLLVESRIDVYPTVSAAQNQLADYAASFDKTNGNGGGPTAVPTIADGATAFTIQQGAGSNTTRYFGLAWRRRNLVAYIQTEGIGGSATLDGAVALARAQDKRIAAS